MITARPRILIKVTFLKHFALEVWVSILAQTPGSLLGEGGGLEVKSSTYPKGRIFALKFSRSPCFDNRLSESIHTCTISTL